MSDKAGPRAHKMSQVYKCGRYASDFIVTGRSHLNVLRVRLEPSCALCPCHSAVRDGHPMSHADCRASAIASACPRLSCPVREKMRRERGANRPIDTRMAAQTADVSTGRPT